MSGCCAKRWQAPSFQELLQTLLRYEIVVAVNFHLLGHGSHFRMSKCRPRKKILQKEFRIQQEHLRTYEQQVIYEGQYINEFRYISFHWIRIICANKQNKKCYTFSRALRVNAAWGFKAIWCDRGVCKSGAKLVKTMKVYSLEASQRFAQCWNVNSW